MLKKLELPMENLHQLVQIDDASVGVMIKAIYRYATSQEIPDFGKNNQLLSFVFAIFQPLIDEQIAKSEHRSSVNSCNAKGKNGNGNDKPPKSKGRNKKSDLQPIVSSPYNSEEDSTTDLERSSTATDLENPSVCDTGSINQTPFSQIAAIYPKKANSGPYFDEAQELWTALSEDEKSKAIAFAPIHLATSESKYLNEYLKLKVWQNTVRTDLK